jgi:hypothetical protein
MSPQPFHESNLVLKAPAGMEETCGDLHVYATGTMCISCWQPTPEERERIAAGGPVWLTVVAGESQPPVAVSAESPFLQDAPSG